MESNETRDYPQSALTEVILQAAYEVHSTLGPGMLESAYEACLFHELTNRGLRVARQVQLPITYKDLQLDAGYRIDLLAEDAVIVEVKAVEMLNPIHEAQLLTYMKLSKKQVGLLLNFNTARLKHGIKRLVLTQSSPSPLSESLRPQR